MIVKFEDKEYTVDVDEIDLIQAMFIKSKTGYTLKAFQEAISEADPDALQALYWLMHEQNGTRLVYERMNFPVVKFYGAFAEAVEAEDKAKGETPDPPTRQPRKDSSAET